MYSYNLILNLHFITKCICNYISSVNSYVASHIVYVALNNSNHHTVVYLLLCYVNCMIYCLFWKMSVVYKCLDVVNYPKACSYNCCKLPLDWHDTERWLNIAWYLCGNCVIFEHNEDSLTVHLHMHTLNLNLSHPLLWNCL